jgi:hypothetical protein
MAILILAAGCGKSDTAGTTLFDGPGLWVEAIDGDEARGWWRPADRRPDASAELMQSDGWNRIRSKEEH